MVVEETDFSVTVWTAKMAQERRTVAMIAREVLRFARGVFAEKGL